MMDQQCIDSIINVISKSNMADLDFLNTEIRPITCEIDEDGKEKHTVHMSLYDYMYSKVELSEAWVAGNLLLLLCLMDIWKINIILRKERLLKSIIIICLIIHL